MSYHHGIAEKLWLTRPQIQELNYHIAVTLTSDSRSDVEGVRWIITKRAITALATCAFMVLGSLKYASRWEQSQEDERKRLAAMTVHNEGSHFGNGGDRGGKDQGEKRKAEMMGGGEMLVQEGDNPAFVSLG